MSIRHSAQRLWWLLRLNQARQRLVTTTFDVAGGASERMATILEIETDFSVDETQVIDLVKNLQRSITNELLAARLGHKTHRDYLNWELGVPAR